MSVVPKLSLGLGKPNEEDSTPPDSTRKEESSASSSDTDSSCSDSSGSDSDSSADSSVSDSGSESASSDVVTPKSDRPGLVPSLKIVGHAQPDEPEQRSPVAQPGSSVVATTEASGPVKIGFLCDGWTSPSPSTIDIVASCPLPVSSAQLHVHKTPGTGYSHTCSFANQTMTLESVAQAAQRQAELEQRLQQTSTALVQLSDHARSSEAQLRQSQQQLAAAEQRIAELADAQRQRDTATQRPADRTKDATAPWVWLFLVGFAAAVGFFLGSTTAGSRL